jgi:hypothetical protein
MLRSSGMTRRHALKSGAAATVLPLVHIRTAGAAGKLNIGFWDHWVPGANDIMKNQVAAWGEKNKVEVVADFITSSGNKLQLTGVAEATAKTGHDALTFFNWDVARSTPIVLISPKRRAIGSLCQPVPVRRPSHPAPGSVGSISMGWTFRQCIRPSPSIPHYLMHGPGMPLPNMLSLRRKMV